MPKFDYSYIATVLQHDIREKNRGVILLRAASGIHANPLDSLTDRYRVFGIVTLALLQPPDDTIQLEHLLSLPQIVMMAREASVVNDWSAN